MKPVIIMSMPDKDGNVSIAPDELADALNSAYETGRADGVAEFKAKLFDGDSPQEIIAKRRATIESILENNRRRKQHA